jgi:hypothetical protein
MNSRAAPLLLMNFPDQRRLIDPKFIDAAFSFRGWYKRSRYLLSVHQNPETSRLHLLTFGTARSILQAETRSELKVEQARNGAQAGVQQQARLARRNPGWCKLFPPLDGRRHVQPASSPRVRRDQAPSPPSSSPRSRLRARSQRARSPTRAHVLHCCRSPAAPGELMVDSLPPLRPGPFSGDDTRSRRTGHGRGQHVSTAQSSAWH